MRILYLLRVMPQYVESYQIGDQRIDAGELICWEVQVEIYFVFLLSLTITNTYCTGLL